MFDALNAPIGLPNWRRVLACSTERRSAAPATPTRSAAHATHGAGSADSRSTGATATGSASICTPANGWAGSVHSAAGSAVTPSPHRATAATVPPSSVRASVTRSSARARLGTATARPRSRPCRSVIGTPGSRDFSAWTATVATAPPAMSARTRSRPLPRNSPAARPTLHNNGIGAMAAPHSSRTTTSSIGP